MKKRPGSIGTSPKPNSSPASEEAVNRFLVTMQGKLRELEGKYVTLVKQCRGVTQGTSRKDADASFFEETSYLQQLRSLDEDKEKLETELNYLLKAKKTLTEAGTRDDEAVKLVYSELSEALRVAQTQTLKLLQGSDWTTRSRASDIFTTLSDAVWTQVSQLRHRTEGREMKELLNEVVRLEQSKQVLDLQSEEFQESLRQKYKSRHQRDKRKIAALEGELRRLNAALQQDKVGIRSSASSLNVSLGPVASRLSAHYERNARASVSPTLIRKRVSESREELGVAERELLFNTALSDTSPARKLRTSGVQTQLQDTENADLEAKLKTLATASAKYMVKTRNLLGKVKDSQTEDALEGLTHALNSVSIESSIDLERSAISFKDKTALEHSNALLERENARLGGMLKEVQQQYHHLAESLERLQRPKGEKTDQMRRNMQESAGLTGQIKALEAALETEKKLSNKLKKDHKLALEDLIRDCTELTSEVKLLSEEKEQLLGELDAKSKAVEVARGRSLYSGRVIAQKLQEMEKEQVDCMRVTDNRVENLQRHIDQLSNKAANAIASILPRFEALKRSVLLKKAADSEEKREVERVKLALQEKNRAFDQLGNELKRQETALTAEIKRVNSLLSEQKQHIESLTAGTRTKDEEIIDLREEIAVLQAEIAQISEEKASIEGNFEVFRMSNQLKSVQEVPFEASFSFEERAEGALEQNLGSAQDVLEVQVQELEGELKQIKDKLASEEAEKVALKTEKENLTAKNSALQGEMRNLQGKIAELARNIEEIDGERQALSAENDRLKEQSQKFTTFLTEQRQSHQANQRKSESKASDLQSELISLKQDLNSAVSREAMLTEQLASAELTIKRQTAEIETAKLESNRKERELREGADRLKAEITLLEAKHKETTAEMKRQISDFEGQIRKKGKEIEENRGLVDTLKQDQSRHMEELAELNKLKSALETKSRETQQLRESLQSLTHSHRQISEESSYKGEELSLLTAQNATLEQSLKSLSDQMHNLRLEAAAKASSWSQERENQRNQVLALAQSMQETEERCTELRDQAEEARSALKRQENTLISRNAEVKSLEGGKKKLEMQVSSLVADLKAAEIAAKAAKEDSEAAVSALNAQLQTQKDHVASLESELERRSKSLEALQTRSCELESLLGSSPPTLLAAALQREKLLSLRLSLWASDLDIHISEENFEKGIERFTDALALLAKEKQSLERNLNSVLESTAQAGDSSSELRMEIEKLHGKMEGLRETVEMQRRDIERLGREGERGKEALEEERRRWGEKEREWEGRNRDLLTDVAAKETRCMALEREVAAVQQALSEAEQREEAIKLQLAQKTQELENLQEVGVQSSSKAVTSRPTSPDLDFAEEEIAHSSPGSELSFRDQLQRLVQPPIGPGSVVKTVQHDGQVWNLISIGDQKYSWVLPKAAEGSDSGEDAEDRMRKMEFELMKQQQTLTKAAEMLRQYTPRVFPDVIQAINYVLSQFAASPRPRPQSQHLSAKDSKESIFKLQLGGLRDSQDLLDTPRVMSNRTPKEPSSSMERQFQLIEQGKG